jgi:hypothetical protein
MGSLRHLLKQIRHSFKVKKNEIMKKKLFFNRKLVHKIIGKGPLELATNKINSLHPIEVKKA